jgi:menaquinone-dependent protoporphyrinogen IX oxidase
MARVLVAYASGTGCDSACAVDIANEIGQVPEIEVDAKPMRRVNSIEAYTAVYVGWVHPSSAAQRELERFLQRNADLVLNRPVWIVHHHPGCAQRSSRYPMKMTRLVLSPQVARPRKAAVPAARRSELVEA